MAMSERSPLQLSQPETEVDQKLKVGSRNDGPRARRRRTAATKRRGARRVIQAAEADVGEQRVRILHDDYTRSLSTWSRKWML